MGNFEKLSVLVIVVIIVMILVVALYTWTDKPSDEGTSADNENGTPLMVDSDPTPGPDPQPDDVSIPDDNASSGGDVEIPIHMPEIDPLPDARIGDEPEVIKPEDEVIAEETGPWVYTVKKGDVFSVVCNRELGGYYKHLPALKQLNPGMDFNRIQIGQVINMPPRGSGDAPASGAMASEGTTVPVAGEGGVPGGEYVVRQGESLKDIAKRVYGDWTVWPRIYATNMTKIKNPEYPTPGTRLKLPILAQR